MKALSKSQVAEKSALAEAIRDAHNQLTTDIGNYNDAVAEARVSVDKSLDTLNEKVREAREWLDNIASDMQSYYDERSETWQDGEKGQDYQVWKDQFELISTDDVEVEKHDLLEIPDCPTADELEDLPDEV